MQKKSPFHRVAIAGVLLSLAGCQGIQDQIEEAAKEQLKKEATALFQEAAQQYPTYLAIASPFAYTAATDLSVPPPSQDGMQQMATELPKIRQYEDLTRRIHAMLSETEKPEHCRFDPGMLLRPARDASCYGPDVKYENHPDSVGASADGSLPHGDTGLWSKTDAKSGQACAAEQLNAGLDSVGHLTSGALMGLASMICTARVNDIAIDQAEIDLTDKMNALGMKDVTFSKAILRHPGEKQFSYSLAFELSGGDHKNRIAIEMEHAPGEVTTAYSGKVWYRVSDDLNRTQCPQGSDSRNGTLVYNRTSDAELAVQVKGGIYCGKDADGRNTDGVLDPADKRTPQNENGWQHMFDILTGRFTPATLAGDYSYVWQAGAQDNNSRVFNVHVAGNDSSVTGDAFFGYGADIGQSDGSIKGFICNWAGPGNSHVLQPFAQHQKMSRNGDDLFVADVSEIAYAPTNSCGYDGLGAFTFDSDGNGMVDTDPATAFVSELLGVTDGNADGQLDEIVATGFVLPKP